MVNATARLPTARSLALVALSLAGAASAAGQPAPLTPQQPTLTEEVEVRVINVDVIVLDRNGKPVGGLERDDFELRVDGAAVPIEYFSVIADGAPRETETDEPGAAGAPSTTARQHAPILALVWDAGSLGSSTGLQVRTAISGEVDRLVESARGVMVAHIGERLQVTQPLTRSAGLVKAALEGLPRQSRALGRRADQRSLLRAIEVASGGESEDDDAGGGFGSSGAEGMVDLEATSLHTEIEQQAEREQRDLASTVAQLEELVHALGALPGRKEVLYVGQGFDLSPGRIAYEIWHDKFASVAARLGLGPIDTTLDANALIHELASTAAAHQVVIHTLDAGRDRSSGVDAGLGTFTAARAARDQADSAGDFLASVAANTGGESSPLATSPGTVLDRVLAGFDSYYSLGFAPPVGADRVAVDVRTRDRGHDLRYWRRISIDDEDPLERLAVATLLAGELENPLRARVEMGALVAEGDLDQRGRRGRRQAAAVLSFQVRIPISSLVLLPEDAQHAARLTVVVAARGPAGEISEPARSELPFAIANQELLRAMAREVAVPVRIALGGGEQEIVAIVRDDIGRSTSALRFTTQVPERPPRRR